MRHIDGYAYIHLIELNHQTEDMLSSLEKQSYISCVEKRTILDGVATILG